ncbi:PH domain-containing protein [Methylobacterium sp. NPDC080182]|uniref:PH domain-containing protein n=1 Tax=Methylobacterium sp. NPDC080182 TaxID=3390590 RepID=UPI003D061156
MPEQLRTRLLPNEKVIWWGPPAQGIRLTRRDGLLIPFSLLWGGFAIFWETTVLRSGAPFPFALFGVPFVLVGLFLIAGRFLFDSWLRQRTMYVLTNRRVLITRSGPWPHFTAVNLDMLPEASLEEESNGRGTIRFGGPASVLSFNGRAGFGSWTPALDPVPQFIGVDDAQRVFAATQDRPQRRF